MVARDPTNSEILARLESSSARAFYRGAIRNAWAVGNTREEMRADMRRAVVDSFRVDRGTVLDRGPHFEESYYSVAMRVFDEELLKVLGPEGG